MMSNCDNCIFRGQWCEKENKCPLFKEDPDDEAIDECLKCMKDAPWHWWCCRMECGEHEFCRGCEAEARKQPERNCR